MLFLILTFSAMLPFHQACDPADLQSLKNFSRNITSSVPLNWSASIDCCYWEGIGCNAGGRVTSLSLSSRQLKGRFSRAIWDLTRLTHLNLSRNQLYGPLGVGVTSPLVRLQSLDLSFNQLRGELPSFLLSKETRVVDLSSNFFHGVILSVFSQSRNLTSFRIRNNSFTEGIPSDLCLTSPNIKLLDFSHNNFNGTLPGGFSECSRLQVLHAGFNKLSGLIPEGIYDAVSLQEISIPDNYIFGSISQSIKNLTNLRVLELYANELTGIIPQSIGNLQKLESLLLHVNNLTGFLPASLSNCTNLVSLNLRVNSLEGELNAFDFSKLLSLQILDLGNNHFSGGLPHSLYSCSSLTAIRLSTNKLSGPISPNIVNLRSLSFLSISKNSLTNFSSAIGILRGCTNLSILALSSNFKDERFPTDEEIGQFIGFENLQLLAVGACQISGELPSWIGKLKQLRVLDISYNKLSGSLPTWLVNLSNVFYLDLSNNLFSENFPKKLCGLPGLMKQNINTQDVIGKLELPIFVTPNFVNDQQYNQLSSLPPALYFANNSLSGVIPPEIGLLKGLHVLDFSYNNFSGKIPDEITKLMNLERLDLSHNNLTGRIPASLSSLTFLSSFSVAYNNLEGSIPSGGQFNTFSNASFTGNPGLCGAGTELSCDVRLETDAKNSSDFSAPVLALIGGVAFGFVVGSAAGIVYPISKLKFLRRFIIIIRRNRSRSQLANGFNAIA